MRRVVGRLIIAGTLVVAAGSARGDDPARLFAERGDSLDLDQAIAAYEAAAAHSPSDPEPRLQLARAEAFWCDLHDGATAGEMIPKLEQGVQAAREALRLSSPGWAEAARQSLPLPQALQAVEPAGALALYWVGVDQHRLAAERGLAALLLEADDLRRIFARVIELAPGTFHGGASLHEAELALALPANYVGTLQTASEALAQAERLAPDWLEVDLCWAERWSVKAQDYGMFKRKLQKIIESPVTAGDSDLGPENELVRKRAQKLIGQGALLFTRASILRVEPPAPPVSK